MNSFDNALDILGCAKPKTKDIFLMHRDDMVMRINFDTLVFDVLRNDLLPFTLRGRLYEVPELSGNPTKYEVTQHILLVGKNKEAIIGWLANRTLLLSRANAKWLYNLLNIEQVDSQAVKAKISIICRSVSVLDNYWLKLDGDKSCWDTINIRKNPLNETIAQVALHGKSLTLQGSLITPEFTTNGAYAKAWRRHADGLWLYKRGHNGVTESKIEVMCSGLLDKMNVIHCLYKAGYDDDVFVCMCPCMSTENLSILSGLDFITYCNINGLNPDKEMLRIDSESIYKMWIVDYLIANRDRHHQNWGFYYDADTMVILGCHPLFDHNNAFDLEYMKDREAPYQFGNMTIRQAAKLAMSKVDFHFTQEITRSDFLTDRQYKEFMWRANDLGVKVIPE